MAQAQYNRLVKKLAFAAIRMGLPRPDRAVQAYIEFAELAALLRDQDVDCVLDVGANRGQFMTALRSIGYVGDIVSFEPSKADYDALLEAGKHDAKWRGVNMALGSEDTKGILNVVPAHSVMSSILPSASSNEGSIGQEIEIRRIDGILDTLYPNGLPKRILLKMDTQGFDLKCFAGASGVMANIVGLYSELAVRHLYVGSPHYLDSLQCYEAAGFELVDLTVVSRQDSVIAELNCMMRRTRPDRLTS